MAGTVIGSHSLEHVYGSGFRVVVPQIYRTLGLSASETAFIASVQTLSSGAGSLVVGFITDMYQHRRGLVLGASALILGGGYLLASVAPAYALLLLAVAFASVGVSLWHPTALGVLSQRFPAQRGLMISLHRSVGNAGETVGPLLVGFLLLTLSWQTVLRLGFPVSLFLALLLALLVRGIGGARQQRASFSANFRAQFAGLKWALRQPAMLTLLAVTALEGMGDRTIYFFLPLYLAVDLGMDSLEVGVRVGLLTALGVVTGPFIGALSDRVGRKPVILAVMLGEAIMSLVIVAAGSGMALVLVLLIAGMFMYSVNSLIQAAALDIVEGQRLEGTFVGLSWGFNSLFNGVSPLLAGALAELFGFKATFYYATVALFLGFLLATRLPGLRGGQGRADSQDR